MNSAEINRTQRILALLALGICDALQNEAMSSDEAEDLLFSPHTRHCCEAMGAPAELVDILNEGSELDSIKRLLSSEQWIVALNSIMEKARSFLKETVPSDAQLEKWTSALSKLNTGNPRGQEPISGDS